MKSITMNGKLRLHVDKFQFAKIPEIGKNEVWRPIKEIKENDVVWIRTLSGFVVQIGLSNAMVVTSAPVIGSDYVDLQFTDFVA